MSKDAKRQVRADEKRALERFEGYRASLEEASANRRAVFKRAADAGLSMAEIGEVVGLHRTRVNQIIKGK